MIARILSLPKHNGILVGRDLAHILEPGVVYDVKKYLGEIILTPIGKSDLCNRTKYDFPNMYSDVSDILLGKSCLLTIEEAEDL